MKGGIALGVWVVASAILLGCGGGDTTTIIQQAPAATAPPATTSAGALADAPKQPGEVVVHGDGPRNFGPYDFQAGVYTVKFQQFDPEDPNNPFRPTTSSDLIVSLDRKPGVIAAESQVVLHNFGRNGETQTTLPGGPFYVDVSNAHASYVVRLTPQ